MKRKSLLIVEDDHDARVALRRVFEDLGFKVISAANGIDALKYLTLTIPQLIIVDIEMPLMGGNDFLRIKNANELWKDIPVIVISAHAEKLNLINGHPIMKKPLDLFKLTDLVQLIVS